MPSRSDPAEQAPRRPRRTPRPTPAAWRLVLVTIGLLGAAVNTGNNLVYLMFSLLAAALPVSALLGAFNLRRLHCELKPAAAPRVGTPCTIDVEIESDRRWAGARSVQLAVLTDRGVLGPVLVERVEPGKRTRVQFTTRGTRRGPWRVHAVRVRSTFPLGFLSHERRFGPARELLVLPSARASTLVEGRPSPVPGGRLLTGSVAGTEYAGLRRGSDEDDARKVDWKVTARRGVTIVRETAGESRGEQRLDVGTRCPGEPPDARRRFEERVSHVAGRARCALLERGDTVHLSVNGRDLKTYGGRRGLLPLLRRLARLEPTDESGRPLPVPPATPLVERSGTGAVARRASRPRRTLRGSALAALAIGTIALFVGKGIGAVVLGMLLGSIVATSTSDRFVTGVGTIGRRLWHGAAIVALAAYLVDILIVRRDLLVGSLMLTVFITLFALHNARTVEDDRRLLLVSLLPIVLAVALTTEVVIAVPLFAWLLATVHGLMAGTAVPGASGGPMVADSRGGWVRYAAPAAGTWAATLAACSVVFLAVPHFGTGAFQPGIFRGQRMTGFSDSTTLGDIGRIKLDPRKVMEVAVSGATPPADDLRWRGIALNDFDGRTWTRSYTPYVRLVAGRDGEFRPATRPTDTDALFRQEVRLEPGTATALFAAARPVVVTSRDFRVLGLDGFGNLELPAKPRRRLAYSVASEPPTRDAATLRRASGADPPEVRAANLQLPELDPRIRALAREITDGAGARYDAALAIERWLSGRLRYSLQVDDRGSADPLARFLFDGMPGHCEYFATAMVALARESGIPARFVAGYLRGEKSRFDDRYVVRHSDAHSWVEVHFPGVGWVPFDPTPPDGRQIAESGGLLAFATYLHSTVTRLWDDYLVGIDLDDQARGLLALTAKVDDLSDRLRAGWSAVAARRPLRLAAAAVGLVVALWAARHIPRLLRMLARPRGGRWRGPALPSFYVAALDVLSGRGLSRRPGETPAEFAERAGGSLTERAAERLRELTGLYYRVRFDGVTRERQVTRIARALVGDIRAGFRDGRR